MKTSLEIIKKAGLHPRLKIFTKIDNKQVSTGPQTVKLVADKEVTSTDFKTGKEVPTIRYLFEKDGETYTYEKKIHNEKGEISYFVRRMAELKEGDMITLVGKKVGIRNVIDILTDQDHDEVVDDEGYGDEE